MSNSPLRAIKAKCLECIYDPAGKGTALEQVTACTSYSCPLYSFRPKSAAQKTGRKGRPGLYPYSRPDQSPAGRI